MKLVCHSQDKNFGDINENKNYSDIINLNFYVKWRSAFL